jgi:multicomponent Na+:H+ antiporter subunit E
MGVVLFGVWLLWSGHFTALLISLGAASTIAVILLVARMDLLVCERTLIERPLRSLRYITWLSWQIVKANLDVARRIIDPRLPIRPGLIEIEASQRTELARVIHANSITLTPGTVTVDLDGDRLTVHALSRKAAAELLTGEMDRHVSRLEPPL